MSDQEMKTFLLLAGWICLSDYYWFSPGPELQNSKGQNLKDAYQKQINMRS